MHFKLVSVNGYRLPTVRNAKVTLIKDSSFVPRPLKAIVAGCCWYCQINDGCNYSSG